MQSYAECPPVLRDFLSYHESIKGQSRRTVEEYHLDLRMFLRFLTLMRRGAAVQYAAGFHRYQMDRRGGFEHRYLVGDL